MSPEQRKNSREGRVSRRRFLAKMLVLPAHAAADFSLIVSAGSLAIGTWEKHTLGNQQASLTEIQDELSRIQQNPAPSEAERINVNQLTSHERDFGQTIQGTQKTIDTYKTSGIRGLAYGLAARIIARALEAE